MASKPRTLSIWCVREGVSSSKRRVHVALPPNAPSWRAFMLALCDTMEMEAIEGLYTELYLGPAEPDLQVWRVQTVLAGGADAVYVCRYPEGAATLRCLAAELGTVDGETAATSWEVVRTATQARRKLIEEIGAEKPPEAPYQGPIFDEASKLAFEAVARAKALADDDDELVEGDGEEGCDGESAAERAVKAISRVLQTVPDCPDALAFGMRALANFAMADTELCTTMIANRGAKTVVSSMEQFRGHPGVQYCGCLMIANLTRHEAYREAVADEGGVACVLSAMRHFRANERIQYFGCQALYNLCLSYAESIVEEEGVDELLETMRVMPQNAEVTRICLWLLLELTRDPAARALMLDEFDAVIAVEAAHTRFTGDGHQDIRECAAQVLERLGESPGGRRGLASNSRRGVAVGALV